MILELKIQSGCLYEFSESNKYRQFLFLSRNTMSNTKFCVEYRSDHRNYLQVVGKLQN